MKSALVALGVVAGVSVFSPPVHSWQEQEYTFDISELEKKPYDIGGFVEVEPVLSVLDGDAAFFKIKSFDQGEDRTQARYDFGVRLEGSYQKGLFSLFARTESFLRYDVSGWNGRFDLLEGYVTLKPTLSFAVDLGKVVTKWGTGYARNPVAFVDRPKDPEDPQEALEGFYVLKVDLNKSFEGALKSVAFTPVLLPVTEDVNRDFGEPGHLNFAARLYFLLLDTDVDLLFFSGKSRSTRYGLDFARNLKSNLEVHGEIAWIEDVGSVAVEEGGESSRGTSDVLSGLVGFRYLSSNQITLIAEYYHNGTGLGISDFQSFVQLVQRAHEAFLRTGDPDLLQEAGRLSHEVFTSPNPLQDYLYIRASQKEPFGTLYITPGLTSIVSLEDGSFQIIPELQYNATTNLALRVRTVFLIGGDGTEFGEKRNNFRLELRLRYFF
jgi:hypothetical protein